MNFSDKPSYHCPSCRGMAFSVVCAVYEAAPAVSVHGHQIAKVDLLMCVACGEVWQFKQLVKLPAKEREALRVLAEARREMAKGAADEPH